jgi:hypothetical protein
MSWEDRRLERLLANRDTLASLGLCTAHVQSQIDRHLGLTPFVAFQSCKHHREFVEKESTPTRKSVRSAGKLKRCHVESPASRASHSSTTTSDVSYMASPSRSNARDADGGHQAGEHTPPQAPGQGVGRMQAALRIAGNGNPNLPYTEMGAWLEASTWNEMDLGPHGCPCHDFDLSDCKAQHKT